MMSTPLYKLTGKDSVTLLEEDAPKIREAMQDGLGVNCLKRAYELGGDSESGMVNAADLASRCLSCEDWGGACQKSSNKHFHKAYDTICMHPRKRKLRPISDGKSVVSCPIAFEKTGTYACIAPCEDCSKYRGTWKDDTGSGILCAHPHNRSFLAAPQTIDLGKFKV